MHTQHQNIFHIFICRSTVSLIQGEGRVGIFILFLDVSKKRPYLSWLAVLFAGLCARSHHNDELQMFTEFVSAKLENKTVTLSPHFLLSHSFPSLSLCMCFHSVMPVAWMAVNFKVSLLYVCVCAVHVEWSLIIGFRYNCEFS